MKRWKAAAAAACLVLAAAGCAKTAPSETELNEPAEPAAQSSQAAGGVTMLCTIVDGAEDGALLLAAQEDAAASEVYRLDAKTCLVTVDGQAAEWSDLADGMTVAVSYSGDVLETYPAQFANAQSVDARSIAGGTAADLCGFYLKVLEDLWQIDEGLNSGIRMAGVDLSNAPGALSEAEKAAVAWRFGEEHGVDTVAATYGELVEQGYIDGERLEWADGCLFSISENPGHERERTDLPAVYFDAEKWRSGLGAYFLKDCAAIWAENGSWSDYSIGSEAIA